MTDDNNLTRQALIVPSNASIPSKRNAEPSTHTEETPIVAHDDSSPRFNSKEESAWQHLLQSRILWWDTDPHTINPESHHDWVIARVLEFGSWDDHIQLFQLYSYETIEAALTKRRVPAHIRAFWTRFFQKG